MLFGMEIVAEESSCLLEMLSKLAPDSSKGKIRSWIREGRVSVSGKVIKECLYTVAEGERVSLGRRSKYLDAGIELLYEDRNIVVINKPEGLLSVDAGRGLVSVHSVLKQRSSQRVYPAHRLDRETSGILVFAYGKEMQEALKEQFAAHSIERIYFALIQGEFKSLKGKWESYLAEDGALNVYETQKRRGKRAVTHYRLRKVSGSYSLLEVELETGKKHQIRVHCASAGYPVVGDKRYGNGDSPIGRMGLHAAKLGFFHPMTGKQMLFESPVPKSFLQVFGEE